MGEINRDHEERTLKLVDLKEFKVISAPTGQAADASMETYKKWEIDCADLIRCIPERHLASLARAR